MLIPILYSFRRCPYAMRARMAISYANDLNAAPLSVELREVSLQAKPSQLLDISAKGTVPVLLLPDGKVLEESIEIMDWALSQSDPAALGQVRSNEFGQRLVNETDNEFKLWLDRYKYADRHPKYAADYSRRQAEKFLKKLEDLLAEKTYLIGAKISVFDLAIFPFVRQLAMVDMTWFEQSEYTWLRRWLFALMESEVFISIMKKYPVWENDALPTIFPENGGS